MINEYSSNYPSQKFAAFNNFIAIDSNQVAKATAKEFAHENINYNLLGISSSVGNGATHLSLAILNEIESRNKSKEIFYTSFESLVMNNSSSNEMTVFNSEFLNTKSLILIDSFYETSNKTFSNNFFDVLKDVKTKIIFTYNKEVKKPIVTKEIHLTCPSKVDKEIIIKNILEKEKKNLSLEIINYISDQIHLSIREIEGLLVSIFAKQVLGNFKADIKFVMNIHHKLVLGKQG
jgi:chromosomal replication initiation ATPase DnaA